MILAVIRHGETDYNKKGLIQGNLDIDLNETGINQVIEIANYLKRADSKWDQIGSSNLKRAINSAQIIADKLNFKAPFIDLNFNERNFGPFEGKLGREFAPTIMAADFFHEGFEDNQQLLIRTKRAIKNLHSIYKGNKVLVVTHAHVIRSLTILSDPIKFQFNTFEANRIKNSDLYYFEIDDDKIHFLKTVSLVDSKVSDI